MPRKNQPRIELAERESRDGKGVPIVKKLSNRRMAERFYAAVNDKAIPPDGRNYLWEWFHQMLNDAGVTFEHPAFFTEGFLMAARLIEATPKPRRLTNKNLWRWGAHKAYAEIQSVLERLEQGESLADIHAEYEAKRAQWSAQHQAKLQAEREQLKKGDKG